jgi:hypothetical protein
MIGTSASVVSKLESGAAVKLSTLMRSCQVVGKPWSWPWGSLPPAPNVDADLLVASSLPMGVPVGCDEQVMRAGQSYLDGRRGR